MEQTVNLKIKQTSFINCFCADPPKKSQEVKGPSTPNSLAVQLLNSCQLCHH